MSLSVRMGPASSRKLLLTMRNLGMGGIVSSCCELLVNTARSIGGRSIKPPQHTKKKKNFTIAIEGNIGSGKTSLLNHFSRYGNVETLKEPVDRWRNIQGHNGLGLMYKDPCRWSLTFQTYVQLTMLQAHAAPSSKPVKMMERSIYSAKYCFVTNLHQSQKMPDVEYVVLTEWFDWILANERVDLDLMVYLRTDPEVVYERIKRRCRKEEEAIPIDYLRALHQLHEDWLIHRKMPLPCPVLVLDGNPGLEDMSDLFEAHKDEILCANS